MEFKGNWEEHKSHLQQKIESLTRDDLLFIENKKEEMLEKLQDKLGISKDELRKIVDGI